MERNLMCSRLGHEHGSIVAHWMHSLCAGLALGLAPLILNGCDARAIGNLFGAKSPYPVTSSGLIFGARMFLTPIYWIDNDHALFPGYERTKDADGKLSLRGAAPAGIFIWDVKNNTYTRQGTMSEPSWFMCFNKGFLFYSNGLNGRDNRGPKYAIKAGMLGQEKQLQEDIFWNRHPELGQCDEPKAEVRPEHRDGGINFLRAEDGYIYIGLSKKIVGRAIGPDNQNDQVTLYRPGKLEPVTLPILAKELNYSSKQSYSEYAGKYIIIPDAWKGQDVSGNVGAWPHDLPRPIYVLSPDGTIQIIQVPVGPWHSMNAAYLTTKGVFIVSNNAVGANSKNAGGYLLQDGKITKLFDHLVDGAGVSPDGCKIAYANNDFNPKTNEYVQVIDVCK